MPGIHIPDAVIKRLEGADNQKEEGKQLCIDIINEVKEIEGVSGVHVMAYRQEEFVAEIIHEFRRAEGPPALEARNAAGRRRWSPSGSDRHRDEAVKMRINCKEAAIRTSRPSLASLEPKSITI